MATTIPIMPEHAAPGRHVFVYGTLRAGGSNDIRRRQPAPEFVGEGFIAGTLFDLGAYPGVRLGGPGWVRGEIYRIEPALEAALDRLEGVLPDGSGEYLKREWPVRLRSRVGPHWQPCLVYELHPARAGGRLVIESGDWLAPP